MIRKIVKEQAETGKNPLDGKEVQKDFKSSIRMLFFNKVENTEEFKKFFPNSGKETSLPEKIMGSGGDKRKKGTMEREINKNDNNIKDFIGSQKPSKFVGNVIPFGDFMKSSDLSSEHQQKKLQELKPTSDSRIENYGV